MTDTPIKILSPTARELRTIRASLGLSQAKMAARLGCSTVALARWETDARQHVRMRDMALRLARFLAQQDTTPAAFVPDGASVGMHLTPGTKCVWETAGLGRCRGAYYHWQAPLSAFRHLETEACLFHGRETFQAICEALRGVEARQPRPKRMKTQA